MPCLDLILDLFLDPQELLEQFDLLIELLINAQPDLPVHFIGFEI